MFLLAPAIWKGAERFEFESDYRIPIDLSADYWLYDRWARIAAEKCDTLVLGDSVVWGHYVRRNETLSHYLNQAAGKERFANAGLDGLRQVVMAGLFEHYGGAIAGKKVVLQCNLLWMSSPKADLSAEEDLDFNHKPLAPQFFPRVPGYALRAPWEKIRDQLSPRIAAGLQRGSGFSGWTNHLQQAYYDRTDIPSWTVEHPYENPFKAFSLKLPPSDFELHDEAIPWTERGIKPQEFAWVDPESSVQWRFFKRAVEILKSRGNQVFVVVGPFNEHLIAPAARPGYDRLKGAVEEWLRSQGVPFVSPAALPSELYADASHPLAKGYEALAKQILESSLLR
jgi:hypothetical protein